MAGMYGCFKGRNSDSAAMASGTPDMVTNQEPAEVQEECSGKKKSKFQTFKKFFARKKRKEPSAVGADAGLKASQSSDNVSKASENNTLTRAEKDKGSGSKISLGSKALSHDSVFVSDSSEANEALGASQDSIHGKVKSLQLQLKQAIKLGSPPSLMCVKKAEDGGAMSEDDGLPCSPPEYTTSHTVMNQGQRNSAISLEGIDSDDDQLSCAASSRAMSPLVVPGDFSQPASPFVCLDNSAAKHKLGLRQKAKRRPATRPEEKAGRDSVVEATQTTLPEAETVEQEEQQGAEDITGDLLKPKAEKEEEEESEDKEQPQHSTQCLLGDEEGDEESEAEQDVSHGPVTSCPLETNHSEEEDSDARPSSNLSSRASSLDSPRATPEPPAGLMGISAASGAEENKDVSDSASESEEDGVQENREEENSFLQEVLSSLKTPLVSSSLDMKTEDAILDTKEDEPEEEEREEVEMEEGEGEQEEEAEVEEPLSYQAAASSSVLSNQTEEEAKEEVVTSFWQEKEEEGGVASGEEMQGREEEEMEGVEEDEEEELVVERFIHPDDEEGGVEVEAVEVKPKEENDVITSQAISQAGEDIKEEVEEEVEEEESEGEEEAIELEKEPEVEEEGQEKREEDEEVEVEVSEWMGVKEAEEAKEEESGGAEEMPEMFPDAQGEEVQASAQEADEGVVLEDDSVYTVQNEDEIPTEEVDQVLTLVREEQEDFNQSSGDERAEEGVELDLMEQNSDQEEDMEASQSDADETEQDLALESVGGISHSDIKQVEEDPSETTEQPEVSSKPSSLSLPETQHEPHLQESGASTPSKISTTAIHINLVSPSSEKATSMFQLPPAAADHSESATEAPSHHAEFTSVDKEQADTVEEEKQPTQAQEVAPPASVEEKVRSAEQSKVRFTIAPAWQRSKSLTPPSSPSASSSSPVTGPSGEELEAPAIKDSVMTAGPTTSPKVELVLSPSRVKTAESITAKPLNYVTPVPFKPQTSAAACTEESSVIVEGNPDNPFGVRLRKTSALLRFSSEEENTEPPVESQTQPTASKVDSPQPISVKPAVCQPVGNKPALPKKPEVHGDSGGKLKRVSDPAAGRGVSGGSDAPSWISVAKQKQKLYKESSLEEITVKKEEQERKSSLPTYVSSAAGKENGSKTAEPKAKVSHLEMTKPSLSVNKEARRPLSPPTPVPPQPLKSQPLPCPVAPKPQVPPAPAKYPPQPNPPQRSLSTPVTPKSPPCTTPPTLSKTPPAITCPPFSSKAASEKSTSGAPVLSGQTASSQRSPPSPALPQDEPPWMALAKKKAKAWSEMPQIVQ